MWNITPKGLAHLNAVLDIDVPEPEPGPPPGPLPVYCVSAKGADPRWTVAAPTPQMACFHTQEFDASAPADLVARPLDGVTSEREGVLIHEREPAKVRMRHEERAPFNLDTKEQQP